MHKSRLRMLAVVAFLIGAHSILDHRVVCAQDTAVKSNWFDTQAKWKGFDQFHFQHSGSKCYLIVPPKALPGNPWIWRARFPGFHADMDEELIGKGFHLAYFDVAGKFGSPETIDRATSFYDYLVKERGLNSKPVLEGVSRGGLFVYNWAARNPSKVACIYCDTPVCDFRSWPGGKGGGIGSVGAWKQCLQAYGLSEEQAAIYKGLPIDHAEVIAKAEIPLMHIVSENDRVVPPFENTYVLRDRLKKLGHQMQIIKVAEGTEKSNGHHFTHPEPAKVVDFIFRLGK